MSTLKVKCIDPRGQLPTRKTEGAAGYDLSTSFAFSIGPHERRSIPLGIAVQIASGYYGRIASRSSLASQGLDTKAGTIDSDYRGELIVLLQNDSEEYIHIAAGDRVAQLIVSPVSTPEVEKVDNLDSTQRGGGGFGSTGQ